MKIAEAIAILVVGPLLGVLVAFVLATFALPPQALNGGRAPGDGFLIMTYIFFSLFVSVPLSVLLAGVVLFRSGATAKSE